MKITLVIICVVIAVITSRTTCFLTNRVSYPGLPDDDYTLEDLTRETVLKVVAKYLEDTNPNIHSQGDLTGIDPLSPSTLLQAHYIALGMSECASSSNFEAAIDQIIAGNINVADDKASQSEYHFNAEQIPQGNAKMVNIRTSILAALESDTPMFSAVRDNIGSFLHMLQSFYSNTNWIESIKNEPYTELGYKETLTYPTSPLDEWACSSCRSQSLKPELPKELVCSRAGMPAANLRQTTYLTSGYRSGQDVEKPKADKGKGKCSHGGIFDSSWKDVPTGGINKDSSDPNISPHYQFHKDAANVAINAGVTFFNDPARGLITLVGNAKFERLFNLDSASNALVLVIDDTGSMSEEIAAVKESAIKLVNDFSNTCSAPSQYIISPFNDPGTGPVTDTPDPDTAINALNDLRAHDGGDCPELCMSGIEEALNRVNYPSTVYVWTDADDKDSNKQPTVTALAKAKSATLEFILTGACGGFRRRKKRAVSSSYTTLTEETGGTIYQTSDAEVGTVSNIILTDAQSGVSVLHLNNMDTSTNISIPVDTTMQGLSITVTGPTTPRDRIAVYNPSGTEIEIADVVVDAAQLFSFLLDTDVTGSWTLRLDVPVGDQYSIDVSTRSFVDFSFQILQKRSGVFVPVEGQPIAGSGGVFRINVISSEMIDSVDKLVLHNSDGSHVLIEAGLSAVGGRTIGGFVANVTLPSEPFTVSIRGTDTDGNAILRLRPGVVQVFDFKMERNNTLDDLVPGGSGTLEIILLNLGNSDNFALGVTLSPEDAPISVDNASLNISVASLEVTPTVVTFTADTGAIIGEVVVVTITMTSQTTGEINFLTTDLIISKPYTVDIPIPVDTSDPSCVIQNVTNQCSLNMINNDCASHRWSTWLLLQDDFAIAEYNISDHNNPSKSESTTDILNPNEVFLNYEANCCCPQVDFAVIDFIGNIQTCSLDFYTPVEDKVLDDLQCSDFCVHIDMVTEMANQISFSWNLSPWCLASEGFQIQHKLLIEDQCLVVSDDLTEGTILPWISSTSATLSDLKPYSTYRIMITTRQVELGADLPVYLQHNTSESAPIGVPDNIKVMESKGTSISLSWDTIPCGLRGGVIQYYEYQIESAKEHSCNTTGKTTNQSYSGTGLSCKGPLKFRVAGVTGVGIGPYSDFVSIASIACRFSPGNLGNIIVGLLSTTLYQLIN